MNRFAPLALAALLTVPAYVVHAAATVGQPAPAFSVKDSQGKTHTLAQYKGKTVVLEWTNDQCPFVKKHYGAGNMQTLQKEAAGSGVVWLSVISSAPGKQGHVSGAAADALTASRKAVPAAVLLDESGAVGRAYGAKTTPHMYVIDKAGTLVYAGGIDDKPSADPADIPTSKNYIKLALADLAAGKAVATSTSRPYGCSVKY